jgi:hypothetical protein
MLTELLRTCADYINILLSYLSNQWMNDGAFPECRKLVSSL